MNGKTALKRLERLARLAQQKAQDDAQRIREIEVYCDGELLEVIPLPIPYRLYELDDTGRRRFVEPDEAHLAIEEKFRRLVHGD